MMKSAIVSVNSITKFVKRDTFKYPVYAFDNEIDKRIKEKGSYFPKLFRHLPKDASLFEIGQNIIDDFNLGSVTIRQNRSSRISTYGASEIRLTPSVVRNHCLEILLHEFAHLFNAVFFPADADHDGGYLVAFRFLLNHYDIISNEEFDEMVENSPHNIQLFKDYLISFEVVAESDLEATLEEYKNLEPESKLIKEKYKESLSERWTYRYVSFHADLTAIHLFNEESKDTFVYNPKMKGIGFIIKLNYFKYEKAQPFECITEEELLKTMLVSPVANYDSYGYIIRSKHAWYEPSFKYKRFDEVLEDNIYYRYKNEHIVECDFSDRALAMKERTAFLKDFRKEGWNIIIAKNNDQFDSINLQLMKKTKEILEKKEAERIKLEEKTEEKEVVEGETFPLFNS